ncbi:MAG: ribosome-binding factor A [Paraglaciecola sp.]|jgi:ribosome-binding factor A
MKETKRMLQVGEMIRRNFGIVLQQEGSYIYGMKPFVTVTNVIMSPDLGIAKIYVSVYNIEDKFNVILEMENEMERLRASLYYRIRKQMRRMPLLQFYQDDTLDEMSKLNEVFDKIKNGTEEEE